MHDAVGYIRVSTQEQGKSGLGLEAQRERIERFCLDEGFAVVEWFTDIQSGKGDLSTNLRPGLAAALAKAKRLKCHVLVAKLDRLSRNMAFVATLMNQKIPFIVCDFGPDVDRFMLHIYAAVAEKERDFISDRIRAALAAKKARGERLGRECVSSSNPQESFGPQFTFLSSRSIGHIFLYTTFQWQQTRSPTSCTSCVSSKNSGGRPRIWRQMG